MEFFMKVNGFYPFIILNKKKNYDISLIGSK